MPRESFAQKAIRAQLVKQNRPPTLLELCLIRAGLKRGPQVLLSAWWWARVVREHPDNPTGELLAQVAKVSVSTGFRYLAELREAFPGQDLDLVVEQIERLRSGASVEDDSAAAMTVGALPVPGLELA